MLVAAILRRDGVHQGDHPGIAQKQTEAPDRDETEITLPIISRLLMLRDYCLYSELLKLAHTTHVKIIFLSAALGCDNGSCVINILDLMVEGTGGLDRRRLLDTIHLNGGGGHFVGEEMFARTVGQRKPRLEQTSGWSYTPSLYAEEDRTHARINTSGQSE